VQFGLLLREDRIRQAGVMSIETEDGGVILDELVGTEVTGILLNGAIRMSFAEGRSLELTIERDFTVRSFDNPDGAAVEFRPYLAGWKPSGMNELASLFKAVVTAAVASADATLRMSFEDGHTVEVFPDPDFEAWHFWINGELFGQRAGSGLT
jgi:Family of unknown function (DUF6188)